MRGGKLFQAEPEGGLSIESACGCNVPDSARDEQSLFMHIPQSVSEARWAVEVSTELVHQSKEDPG